MKKMTMLAFAMTLAVSTGAHAADSPQFRGPNRDGIFPEGAATCEYYWTIRDGVMIVADEKGSRTMELRPAKHGIWEGQWLNHEKMPVLLVP